VFTQWQRGERSGTRPERCQGGPPGGERRAVRRFAGATLFRRCGVEVPTTALAQAEGANCGCSRCRACSRRLSDAASRARLPCAPAALGVAGDRRRPGANPLSPPVSGARQSHRVHFPTRRGEASPSVPKMPSTVPRASVKRMEGYPFAFGWLAMERGPTGWRRRRKRLPAGLSPGLGVACHLQVPTYLGCVPTGLPFWNFAPFPEKQTPQHPKFRRLALSHLCGPSPHPRAHGDLRPDEAQSARKLPGLPWPVEISRVGLAAWRATESDAPGPRS
jgi:hypothetical protein